MNEVQERLKDLQEKGWTLAAIADELGLTVNAVVKWKAGDRTPNSVKSVLEHLDRLLLKRRVPRQRRYPKGSRVRTGGEFDSVAATARETRLMFPQPRRTVSLSDNVEWVADQMKAHYRPEQVRRIIERLSTPEKGSGTGGASE